MGKGDGRKFSLRAEEEVEAAADAVSLLDDSSACAVVVVVVGLALMLGRSGLSVGLPVGVEEGMGVTLVVPTCGAGALMSWSCSYGSGRG